MSHHGLGPPESALEEEKVGPIGGKYLQTQLIAGQCFNYSWHSIDGGLFLVAYGSTLKLALVDC